LEVCAEVECGLKDEFLEIELLLPVSFTDGVLCARVKLVASEWATKASAESAGETTDRWAAGGWINRRTVVGDLDQISKCSYDSGKWYDLLAGKVIYDVRSGRVLLRRVEIDGGRIYARDGPGVADGVGRKSVSALVVGPAALDRSTKGIVLVLNVADGDDGKGV
jgi:hypothetical protein